MIFTGYNPYGPHTPQPAAPDVPIEQFQAAQRAGASHLSADGKRAYCQRYDVTFEAEYDGAAFGSWWPVAGLPPDAVRME